MPADPVSALVQAVHASGRQLLLALTGGGSRAIAALLTEPGASRSVLEATVPYSSAALVRYLGGTPDHFCSPETARAMAMASFERGRTLAAPLDTLAGIGCTASLASDRPKRGPHRLHAALQTLDTTLVVSLELKKDLRSRAAEEELAGRLVLNLAAEACGVGERLPLELTDEEKIERQQQAALPVWRALFAGEQPRVAAGSSSPSPLAIFPGAFHPLHAGHRQIVAAAERLLGVRPAYELSIANVDKPPLDYIEIQQRTAQFAAGEGVWLTRAPRFLDKVRLFPGATFCVGVDTVERIADARYYPQGGVEQACDDLAASGCRFLVFGRLVDGRFRTLSDMELPAALRRLCREVGPDEFRLDISSTELRQTPR